MTWKGSQGNFSRRARMHDYSLQLLRNLLQAASNTRIDRSV